MVQRPTSQSQVLRSLGYSAAEHSPMRHRRSLIRSDHACVRIQRPKIEGSELGTARLRSGAAAEWLDGLGCSALIYVVGLAVRAQSRLGLWKCVWPRKFQAESSLVLLGVSIVVDDTSKVIPASFRFRRWRKIIDAIADVTWRNRQVPLPLRA